MVGLVPLALPHAPFDGVEQTGELAVVFQPLVVQVNVALPVAGALESFAPYEPGDDAGRAASQTLEFAVQVKTCAEQPHIGVPVFDTPTAIPLPGQLPPTR